MTINYANVMLNQMNETAQSPFENHFINNKGVDLLEP